MGKSHHLMWLFTVFIISGSTGCTVVHHQAETEDSWEVPRSFERNEDAEDDELIFALQHRGDGVSATVRRIQPAYPHGLLPYAISLRAGLLDPDDAGVNRRTSPPGWHANWLDEEHGRWTHVYAFTGTEASYFLAVHGPGESTAKERELFDELVAGFSPSDAPQVDETIPSPELATTLSDPSEVQLEPVDADDQLRSAVERHISAPHLLTAGLLLYEPLTYAIDASAYLDLLLQRLDHVDGGEPIDVDNCTSKCAVVEWKAPSQPGHTQIAGVAIIDDSAFQIRLSAPRSATELHVLHKQWISEFLSGPRTFFESHLVDGGE